MEDLALGELTIPAEELEERFDTSGGPGGQHANRSQTAVTLRFDVTRSSLPVEARDRLIAALGEVVEVRSAESRSQSRNRSKARQRLAARLMAALDEPKRRKKTKPPAAADRKRLADKTARSAVKRHRRPPTAED